MRELKCHSNIQRLWTKPQPTSTGANSKTNCVQLCTHVLKIIIIFLAEAQVVIHCKNY